MSLRSGKLPFLGSEDEFFYHTGTAVDLVRTATGYRIITVERTAK
jgi:hypothetical protein